MNARLISLLTLLYQGKKSFIYTPVVLVKNKLVTTFLVDIFNAYVSEKCQPISYHPSTQTFETINRLSTVDTDSKTKQKNNTRFKF